MKAWKNESDAMRRARITEAIKKLFGKLEDCWVFFGPIAVSVGLL
jgi:hypothetical protein